MDIPKRTQFSFAESMNGIEDRGHDKKTELSLRNDIDTNSQRTKDWVSNSELHRRDLEIATRVQKASFPPKSPAIPGLRVATFYKPAHAIGGDYYDFLPVEDGAWGIGIGDVSGKGIAAALVMATLQASLRSQVLRSHSTIETLMGNVNRLLDEFSPAEFFASLFYAEYQPKTRCLTYVNAGHNPPMIVRRGPDGCTVFLLHSGGAPVGVFRGSRYTAATFQLEPGDLFMAYTDGITESENSAGEPFGQNRLQRILCRQTAGDAQEILRTILLGLAAHSAGRLQSDDMTLVVAQVEDQSVLVPRISLSANEPPCYRRRLASNGALIELFCSQHSRARRPARFC